MLACVQPDHILLRASPAYQTAPWGCLPALDPASPGPYELWTPPALDPTGVLPFKDGFYSSSSKQVGGQTEGPETSPDREALMATLSCAMVGPMDGIYLLNKTRIMTTCMADGTVLKPDAPVHTSEWCFTHDASSVQSCYVYYASSDVASYGRVVYHYNDIVEGTAGDEPLTPGMVHLTIEDVGKHAVRNWYTGELTLLAASNPLAKGYEGHVYATVHPVADGWVLLGEVDKYVVAASKRFVKVDATTLRMSAVVNGIAGEVVKVCAAKVADLKVMCNTIHFAATGPKTTTFR